MKTFSQAFQEHLEASERSVRDVAAASGVNYDALYKLKYGKTQNMAVDDAGRVARVFDKSVEEFLDVEDILGKDELRGLLRKLTSSEQQFLLGSVKAIMATRKT